MNRYDETRSMVIQTNATGYTFKGEVPVAACGTCGGWTHWGGMSQHRQTLKPVMGRYGCLCHDGPRYLKTIATRTA